jgi:hypothetical protein
MINDKTIDRVREARRKVSARFDHDAEKLIKYYIRTQSKHKHRIVGPVVR